MINTTRCSIDTHRLWHCSTTIRLVIVPSTPVTRNRQHLPWVWWITAAIRATYEPSASAQITRRWCQPAASQWKSGIGSVRPWHWLVYYFVLDFNCDLTFILTSNCLTFVMRSIATRFWVKRIMCHAVVVLEHCTIFHMVGMTWLWIELGTCCYCCEGCTTRLPRYYKHILRQCTIGTETFVVRWTHLHHFEGRVYNRLWKLFLTHNNNSYICEIFI